jgi:hypothetical protein
VSVTGRAIVLHLGAEPPLQITGRDANNAVSARLLHGFLLAVFSGSFERKTVDQSHPVSRTRLPRTDLMISG